MYPRPDRIQREIGGQNHRRQNGGESWRQDKKLHPPDGNQKRKHHRRQRILLPPKTNKGSKDAHNKGCRHAIPSVKGDGPTHSKLQDGLKNVVAKPSPRHRIRHAVCDGHGIAIADGQSHANGDHKGPGREKGANKCISTRRTHPSEIRPGQVPDGGSDAEVNPSYRPILPLCSKGVGDRRDDKRPHKHDSKNGHRVGSHHKNEDQAHRDLGLEEFNHELNVADDNHQQQGQYFNNGPQRRGLKPLFDVLPEISHSRFPLSWESYALLGIFN